MAHTTSTRSPMGDPFPTREHRRELARILVEDLREALTDAAIDDVLTILTEIVWQIDAWAGGNHTPTLAQLLPEARRLAASVEAFSRRTYPVAVRFDAEHNDLPEGSHATALEESGFGELASLVLVMRDHLASAIADVGDYTPDWLPALRTAIGGEWPSPVRDRFRPEGSRS